MCAQLRPLFHRVFTIPIRLRLILVLSLASFHALGMFAGFQEWIEVEPAIGNTGLKAGIISGRQLQQSECKCTDNGQEQ
jgi:hypothetical protein